jgi:hypothetical protein
MAGTLFRIGAVQVFIGAEDHPPPHVHAFHMGEGWRARFRFSFLSDVAGLYRFRRRGRRPTETTLNAVLDAVIESLPACRAEWWATHGARHEVGLVNRRLETKPAGNADKILVKVAIAPGPNAIGIISTAYDPVTAKVTLTLADGQHLTLTAGQHIEEADEW